MTIPLLTIFFDANVLIAGLFSQSGASFLLLQLCELGLLKGFTCKQAIDECREAIRAKLPEAEPIFEKIIANSVEVLPNSTFLIHRLFVSRKAAKNASEIIISRFASFAA